MSTTYALLLCAGLGTRLKPLTDERPKPLVPVLGRPLGSYGLERLAAAGVRHVVANTFHLGEQVLPALGPHAQRLKLSFETVQEPRLLGTGGGIRNALPKLGSEPFVVYNGDVLADPDLSAAIALHNASNARMTMILREHPDPSKLGAIEVDEEGRVRRMLDEGDAPTVSVKRCMFTGIYVLSPDVMDDLPEEGCVVRHSLRRWLARGDRVSAVVDARPWYDVGTISEYVRVNRGLLDGSIAYPGVKAPFEARMLDRLAVVEAGVRLGSSLVVGARATLRGAGTISDAIIWDGATVEAPLRNAIVTAAGVRVATE